MIKVSTNLINRPTYLVVLARGLFLGQVKNLKRKGGEKMKRLITFMAIFALVCAVPAFAGVRQLSDNQMDEISAGDWVIINDETQKVEDVYAVNNTLHLFEQSQMEINAVSNANAVDSAIAVQTNVSRVTGDEPTDNTAINGTNIADITNYRPQDSGSFATKHTSTDIETISIASGSSESEACSLTLEESSSFGFGSSSSSSLGEALAYNLVETANANGSWADSGKDYGDKGLTKISSVGGFLYDYDKVETLSATKAEAEASAVSGSGSARKLMEMAHSSSSSSNAMASGSSTHTESCELSTSFRSSKGANNHILLDETSQQLLKVVSNLNAVGAGAAVQTNIASNVGVGGSITHMNSATVISGL